MERFGGSLKLLAAGDAAAMSALQALVAVRTGNREQQVDAARSTLLGLLDRVASLDEDRILRSFIGVIDATLRTNYYITYKDGLRTVSYTHLDVYKRQVEYIAALTGPQDLRLSLYVDPRKQDMRFKLYRQLQDIPLSDALPMICLLYTSRCV